MPLAMSLASSLRFLPPSLEGGPAVALGQIQLAEDLIYDFAMRQARNELMTRAALAVPSPDRTGSSPARVTSRSSGNAAEIGDSPTRPTASSRRRW
jgi:hypothetical protein